MSDICPSFSKRYDVNLTNVRLPSYFFDQSDRNLTKMSDLCHGLLVSLMSDLCPTISNPLGLRSILFGIRISFYSQNISWVWFRKTDVCDTQKPWGYCHYHNPESESFPQLVFGIRISELRSGYRAEIESSKYNPNQEKVRLSSSFGQTLVLNESDFCLHLSIWTSLWTSIWTQEDGNVTKVGPNVWQRVVE